MYSEFNAQGNTGQISGVVIIQIDTQNRKVLRITTVKQLQLKNTLHRK